MKRLLFVAHGLLLSILLFSCNDDNELPPIENAEETITQITLTFTPDGGGTPVVATWEDADGEGSGDPVLTLITLASNTAYTLAINLTNAIDPDNPEGITEEIRDESDEHMFFFAWTDGLFTNPTGDGNIDNRDDPVEYEDTDPAGLPVGLMTRWTADEANSGTFRVVLRHQPGTKSATSTFGDGAADVDVIWDIEIR